MAILERLVDILQHRWDIEAPPVAVGLACGRRDAIGGRKYPITAYLYLASHHTGSLTMLGGGFLLLLSLPF